MEIDRIVTFKGNKGMDNFTQMNLEYLKNFSHLNELRRKEKEYVNRWSNMIKTNNLKTIKIYLEIVLCNKHLNE